MPFTSPWASYSAGHLIFGLEEEGRSEYMKRWRINKNKGTLTIDQYIVTPKEREVPAARDDFEAKRQELAASRRPADNDEFIAALQEHSKYKAALGSQDGNDAQNWMIRSKCKGGLLWATTKSKTVHFLLDGIDLNAVIDKNHQGKGNKDTPAGHSGVKSRSITGSELRWVYRNGEKPEVAAHVQFWLNFAQCAPPWVSDPDAWSRYKPKSSVPLAVDEDDEDVAARPATVDRSPPSGDATNQAKNDPAMTRVASNPDAPSSKSTSKPATCKLCTLL